MLTGRNKVGGAVFLLLGAVHGGRGLGAVAGGWGLSAAGLLTSGLGAKVLGGGLLLLSVIWLLCIVCRVLNYLAAECWLLAAIC